MWIANGAILFSRDSAIRQLRHNLGVSLSVSPDNQVAYLRKLLNLMLLEVEVAA